MFQSTGLYRDVPCPYFIFGLCERPYCHFKHSKRDEAKAKAAAAQASEANADTKKSIEEEKYSVPVSSLERTLKDIEENIKNEKNKLRGKHTEVSSPSISSTFSIKTKPTGTPEYNPTPISQLKKQKNQSNQSKFGGSKYELALLDGPSSEQEYDPASNYSSSFKGTVSEVPEYAATLTGTREPSDQDTEMETPIAKIPKFVSIEYTPSVAEPGLSDEEPSGDQRDWFSEEESAKDSTSEHGDTDSDKGNDVIDAASVVNSATKKSRSDDPSLGKFELPFEFTPDGLVKQLPEQTETNDETSEKLRINCKNEVKKESIENITENMKKDVVRKNFRESNIFSIFKAAAESVLSSCDSKSAFKSDCKSDKDEKNNIARSARKDAADSMLSFNSKGKEKTTTNGGENKKSKSSETELCSKPEELKTANQLDKNCNQKSKNKEKHNIISKTDSIKNLKCRSVSEDHHKTAHLNHKSKSAGDKKLHSSPKSKSADNYSTQTNHKSKSTDFGSRQLNQIPKLEAKRAIHLSKSDEKNYKHNDTYKRKDLSRHSSGITVKAKVKEKSKPDSSTSRRRKSSEKIKQMVKTNRIVDLNVDLFGVDSDTETKEEAKKKADSGINNLNQSDIGSENIEMTSPFVEDDSSDLEKYFSDEDPFDECLRIFNEEQAATKEPEKKKLKRKEPSDIADPTPAKKRIGMKPSDPNEKKTIEGKKPVPKPSPAQVMMNRYKMMQQKAIDQQEKEKEKLKEKVRKISAQNAMKTPPPATIADASTSFSSYLASKNKSPQKKTTAITVPKGQKRKAHTPTVPVEKLKRPVVEVSTSSKVPTNIRQRYLNLMIDECLKLFKNEQEAFERATEEEKSVYTGVSNKQIYLNKAVNTIKRLRTEAENKASGLKGKVASPIKMSHGAMLDGASATKTSYTLHRSGGAIKIREEDFTGAELYKRLKPYLLTEEQLKENNFPRPDPLSGGKALFLGEDIHAQKARTKGYEKVCVRCGKIFEVYPNGKYPKKEECVYHWGKAYKKKIAGALETRYTCCSGDLGSEGCQVCKAHVHETNKKENLTGYMKTIPSSPPPEGDYGVYALDCEMVYTTQGVELARVTVVGPDLEPMYESLVQPDNPVVDYNTRFSGITEEDLEDVTTSLRNVQAVLLSLFTARTILIGHSLESDLSALKLIHDTVVDTSIVFPHRLGLPYKRALKNLMAEYLKKIIQDDVAGHDSHEDAISCLQLMQLRLKEDARKEGRR